jgi:hypothetical protein
LAPVRIAELVAIAARALPRRPGCLAASLALQSILRRRGVASALRLGVRTVGTELDAHAWVEADGRVLFDIGEREAAYWAFEQPIASRRPGP